MNIYTYNVGCNEGHGCRNSVFRPILVAGTDEYLTKLDEFHVQEAVVNGEVTMTLDEIRMQSPAIQEFLADDIADAEDVGDDTVIVRVEIDGRCCDTHGSDQDHGDREDEDFDDAP